MGSDGIAVHRRRRWFFSDWRLSAGRDQAKQQEQRGYQAHPRRLSRAERGSQFRASVFPARAAFLSIGRADRLKSSFFVVGNSVDIDIYLRPPQLSEYTRRLKLFVDPTFAMKQNVLI